MGKYRVQNLYRLDPLLVALYGGDRMIADAPLKGVIGKAEEDFSCYQVHARVCSWFLCGASFLGIRCKRVAL